MELSRCKSWRGLAGAALVALAVGLPIVPAEAQTGTFELTDTEVARLFDRPLPALSEPPAVPTTTGHRGADERIAELAIGRGYQHRGSPLDRLGSYQGRRLQQSAIDDLVSLQNAMADEAGVRLSLTSAYRGVSAQRNIFLSRLSVNSFALRGRRVTNAEIADGSADDVLHAVMATAAPPGFSKHHTGYAIDVRSGGFSGPKFENSRAWGWLTEDRYENAMRFGWIPSYPDNASRQGPNPEPWEWVWIGRAAAACARDDSCAIGSLDSVTRRKGTVTGWATAPRADSVRLRLVSVDSITRLEPTPVRRFDVSVALGRSSGLGGFTAGAVVPRKAKWACLEARTRRGGPWARVDCVTFG